MTMHGPYGDYGQDDTTNLVGSLALLSARLWEELFQRLGRLERAQSELGDLVAKIQVALPAALGNDALSSGALRGAESLPGASFSAGYERALGTGSAEFGAAGGAGEAPHTATSPPWFGDHASASAPLQTQGTDDLSVDWHPQEADGVAAWTGARPQILEGVGTGLQPGGPPPPPPGFQAEVPPPPPGFHVGSPPPPPPPPGFQADGAQALTPPPPPPGFHVDGAQAFTPPPPGFSVAGPPPDPNAAVGGPLPHLEYGSAFAPPPAPPSGFGVVRPADPTVDFSIGGFDAQTPSDAAANGMNGLGDVPEDDGQLPPAITPDFFARAGWRRR